MVPLPEYRAYVLHGAHKLAARLDKQQRKMPRPQPELELPLLSAGNDNISVLSEAAEGESDWDRQLREIEENEQWEKSTSQIPVELQSLFIPFLKTLPLQLKVMCMRLCGAAGWQIVTCRNLYDILRESPIDSLSFFVELLMGLASTGTLVTSLAFFAGTLTHCNSPLFITNSSTHDVPLPSRPEEPRVHGGCHHCATR